MNTNDQIIIVLFTVAAVLVGCSSGSVTDPNPVEPPALTCGDQLCNGTETCTSCPSDCDCSTANPCNFDPNLTFDFLGDILQLESADKTTCLWLSRTLSGGCRTDTCLKAQFTILGARIGHGGTVVELTSDDSLVWTDSHHNYADRAEMTTADTRYVLEIKGVDPRPVTFDPVNPTTLSATSTTASQSWGPAPLVPYAP